MLKNNLLSITAGSAALLVTTATLAVPFGSFDPKSMAMGGAGVAVANPATAPLFNPALLSVTNKNDDFALELPVLGFRAFDPDDFVDAVDDFDEDVMDDLDDSINAFEQLFNKFDDIPVTLNAIDGISTGIVALSDEVLTLSDKPFQFEGGAGAVLSIPSEKFGIAFSASATANFSGILNYEDADTVTTLSSDMSLLTGCYSGAQVAFVNCVNNTEFSDFIDISDPANPVIDFTATSEGSDPSDVKSKVRIVGIVQAEAGLTFSREMAMFGTEVAIGLTPKMVSVTVFDYEASADNADTGDVSGDDYSVDYSDFNMDIGFAVDHKNGWRSGLVIKNLIPQDYEAMNTDPDTGEETETGMTISLKPQARVGVSHTNSWSTVALDLDLTENEGLGLAGDNSQYVALGIELDAFDWAQIRVGYRLDTVNSERDIMSAGLGFSPFGIHIDFGVAGNEDEIGASFQLGFRF